MGFLWGPVTRAGSFRSVIAFALVLAFLVSGSAMAGAPGNGGDQLASAAKKKKCKKGKKCKKKTPAAAPAAPVAVAPVVAAPPAPPPAEEQFFPTVDDVLYDLTALNGSFDATVTPPASAGCTLTKDAHWTTTLPLGAHPPAVLSNIYTDTQGPVYIFDDGHPGGIPVTVTGSGVATETCTNPLPGLNGTASCTFNRTDPMDVTISSDPEGSRDPINLEWFFGYNVFYYANPANGGVCASSGANPPSISLVEDSPGLFVSSLNDGSNLLEPPGMSTAPLSQFSGDPTLNFSGSANNGVLNASWTLTASFTHQ